MSHTVRITIELKDRLALAAAIEAMGGKMVGQGRHQLFSGNAETGLGFNLPNWRYPLILREDNTLAFDDYGGHWGNTADLQTLKGLYAIEAARQAAQAQGWMAENQADGSLLIYHPDGPTITVSRDGSVDANGFTGQGCNAASAIEDALGQVSERSNKAEYYAEVAHVRE